MDVTCVIYKRMGELLEGGGDGEIDQSTLEMFSGGILGDGLRENIPEGNCSGEERIFVIICGCRNMAEGNVLVLAMSGGEG